MKPVKIAAVPQMPGAGVRMSAAKCTSIVIQPRSQSPETAFLLRRATNAKAHVNSPTAANSGIVLQSTASTSMLKEC